MLRSRFLFFVSFTSLLGIYFYWEKLEHIRATDFVRILPEYATKDLSEDLRFDQKKNQLSNDLKYMLLWTQYTYAPFYFFEEGQTSFIKNNCSAINCYVTSNRKLFDNDITRFDAIAFNGRTMSARSLPKKRSPHQKYIFFNMESADNYPICDKNFDGFFNWTATYKLSSDIPFTSIVIRNKQGEVVGPQTNMQWPSMFPDVDDIMSARLINKTKAAAWFVSNCKSRSGRFQFVKDLVKALKAYDLDVDIYGSCGPLKCPRREEYRCNTMLERDYFFYMALENSFSEDYVTEKVLTALQHDTVPIVYGGANYSRFLPPGSYIDSKKFDIHKLAATMNGLMKAPENYRQFFKWKSQYTYSDPSRTDNICAVCAAMNDNEQVKTVTVYDKFREWWHQNFTGRC